MISKILIASCDIEVRNILKKNLIPLFGANNITVCNNLFELHEFCKYTDNAAIIFDKYFLGWIISYELVRIKTLNPKILTYFVEIGECSLYFGMRINILGIDGFIPNIEKHDMFKNSFLKVKDGRKVYPEVVTQTIADELLLDKKNITEVTEKEMQIGMFLGMGLSPKEICFRLGYTKGTVSVHTSRLKRKTGYKKPGDYDLLNQRYFGYGKDGKDDN